MNTGQFVLLFQQRIEDDFMTESVGEFEITLVARDCGNVGKGLVESSMLTSQHVLHLLVGEVGSGALHPVGEFHEHILCLLAMSHKIGISQSSVNLVDIVERHPSVVESEGGCPHIALLNLLPHLPSVGHTTQITVAS